MWLLVLYILAPCIFFLVSYAYILFQSPVTLFSPGLVSLRFHCLRNRGGLCRISSFSHLQVNQKPVISLFPSNTHTHKTIMYMFLCPTDDSMCILLRKYGVKLK